MAVNKNQITTVAQAYDYAAGSASAASAGSCPSQASAYLSLAAQVTAGAFTGVDTLLGVDETGLNKTKFLAALAQADAACKAAPDYRKTGNVASIDPQTGGAKPANVTITPTDIVGAGIGGNMPWWVWLAGGAALYFLLKGKKGKKKGKSRRKKTSRRKRRRR